MGWKIFTDDAGSSWETEREPVVGSGWDIFTMDAGSVWETEGGEVGFLVVLPIRQGV